jgi:LmbE family N-acetylglucosaminyl deacetylase
MDDTLTPIVYTSVPHQTHGEAPLRADYPDMAALPATDEVLALAGEAPTPAGEPAPLAHPLPSAGTVLAVIARPGQESAELGALLYGFRRQGASVALLCLTRGEASPQNATCERLEAVRPYELQVAAGLLGISSVSVSDYPDGGLRLSPVTELTERVRRAIREYRPDLLLVVDPAAAGDPDDARVAKAACLAAGACGLPVVARTEPGARRSWMIDLGADAAAARALQQCAAQAHVSQAAARPQLLRRLNRLGRRELLRWLVPPATPSRRRMAAPA